MCAKLHFIHTNYSDGRLTLPEVIDFYGRRGFDGI